MTRSFFIALSALAVGMILTVHNGFANPQQIQQAQKQVKTARDKLDAAEKVQTTAMKAVQAAKTELDAAKKKIPDAKASAEARHQSGSGLTSARERQVEAKKEWEQTSAPVLEKLKASSAYQSAFEASTAAKQEYAAGNADEERAKELKEQIFQIGKMERAAYEADPKTKAAKDKMTQAEEGVATAKKKLAQLVESDTDYQAAQKDYDKSKKSFEEAKAKADKEHQNVTQAESFLTTQLALLNQLQSQQNRPRRN